MLGELEMPPGKLAAQAGHAFLDCWMQALKQTPERARLYHTEGHGSKIVLTCPTVRELAAVQATALSLGYPTVQVIDANHVLLPHFTGAPVVTAIGIGPITKAEASFMRHLHTV